MSTVNRLTREVKQATERLAQLKKELRDAKKAEKRAGKKFSANETAKMRDEIVKGPVLSYVRRVFDAHADLKSAALCVAQYWDDEANDATHGYVAFSSHDKPNLEKCDYGADEWNGKDNAYRPGREFYDRDYDGGYFKYWDSNDKAISVWSSFCKEGASQNDDFHDAYSPYAVFRKQDDGTITIEVVGKMLRPWLDGVRPEWEE